MSAYAKNYGYFFNSSSGDRTYNAESFEEWLKPFFISGVFNGELQVKAQTTPDMTVKVTAGHANLDGKAATWETDNTMQLAVSSGVYDRIDTIVLRRDNVNRTISIEVVTGTASSSPQPTAPVRDADTFELVLAQIRVGAGVTAITQANITDTRMNSGICGWVAATVDQIDFDQIQAQYDAWQEETQEFFTDWFESIRGQLDEDAAGHLQNEIDDLNNDLTPKIINGSTCSSTLLVNDFALLKGSTIPDADDNVLPDGLYFVMNGVTAGDEISYTDITYARNPIVTGKGALNIIAQNYLYKYRDVVDNLTTSDAYKALSAKQGKTLNDKITNVDIRASLNIGADATSTTQEFSNYNGRKFSDFRTLVFYLYDSNSNKSTIRNSVTIPRAAWTSGKSLYLTQNHGVNLGNVSGIVFTYKSDTSINAVTTGAGALTGFAIEGYTNI